MTYTITNFTLKVAQEQKSHTVTLF